MKSGAHAFWFSTISALLGCSMIYDTDSLTQGAESRASGGGHGGGASGQSPTAGATNGKGGQQGSGGNGAAGSGNAGSGTAGTGLSTSGGSPADGGGAGSPTLDDGGGAGAPEPDCSSTWYPDADDDGYGDDSAAGVDCETPGYAPAGDCDDDDPFNNPGLSELCDGIDNDCNPSTSDVCPLNCIPDSTYEGRTYLFCWWPVQTWADASAICAQQQMRMARMDDQAEQDFVLTWHDPDDAWLGGSDADDEGTWTWEDGDVFWDGAPVLFSPWGGTEPNNSGGNEHCLVINTFYDVWNDRDCEATLPFTCERY